MEEFGASTAWVGDSVINIRPGGYARTRPFTVESDWSAASYWYELVALSPDENASVSLAGLSRYSMQGDSRVAEFFNNLGVHTAYTDSGVRLTKQPLPAAPFLQLDLSEQPDLAQTLVVTCAMLRVPFHFTGLQSLRIKETDRIAALSTELEKFGVSLQTRSGGELLWDGHAGEPFVFLQVDTYDDHRMAMAFAPCALRYPGLTINNPEVVSKSYPRFWDTLRPYLRKS